jgi:hypothetical protein
MKTAKATLAHGLIFGLAVILTSTTAQAGHYRHIDDHSRDIEREAERAEAIVKYNFGHAPAPILDFLCESIGSVARTAHQLHELSECSGNAVAIEAVTARLDAQFCDVQLGVTVLREWVTGCPCSVRRFSSSFAMCQPRNVDRSNLANLMRRVDDINEELTEMKQDVVIVMAEHYRSHRHSSHGHVSSRSRIVTPVRSQSRFEPQRQIITLGTFERPGHDFSRGHSSSRSSHSSHSQSFSRGQSSSHGRSSSRGNSGFSFGSRGSGHSRHSDSSYIRTRIGGFGLSFRLR